jgi:hypothetical protein
MPLDFSNPAQGPLGAGMAQNAGAMLKWKPIYDKYVMDESTEGRQPMPMDQFIQTISSGIQQTQPGAAPPQVAPPAQGLMPAPRGLMR